MDAFDLRLWPGFSKAGGTLSQPAFVDQIAIDSRRLDSSHALFVALEGNHSDGHHYLQQAKESGARYALIREDWPQTLDGIVLLRVPNPLHAFQEIAQVYRSRLKTRIIGITGSFGKTMVKDLLQMMLSTSYHTAASPESFNSQIGVPLSLFTIKKTDEIALIEAGISQSDEMDRLVQMILPDYAILTQIGKKHQTTLGNLQFTAREMVKLLATPTKGSWVLLPDHPILLPYLNQFQADYHFWNIKHPSLPDAQSLEFEQHGMSYRLIFPSGDDFHISTHFGSYYFLDLLNMTIKAAWLLGISSKNIVDTLQNFTPEPMRTEIWKTAFGMTLINDSYCSDPQSVDIALKFFDQAPSSSVKTFVFGGLKNPKCKLDSLYRSIGKSINRYQIDKLMLYGNHDFSFLVKEILKRTPDLPIKSYPQFQDFLNDFKSQVTDRDLILIKGEKKVPLDLLMTTFHESICTNQCVINLAAIQNNLTTLRHKLPPSTRVMVMVKAFAYGTDEIRMAKFLETCQIDILGVSYVDEAIILKRAGVKQAIFVINAALYEIAKVVKWDLEAGVSDKEFVIALAKEAQLHNKCIKVHLHVDTGMSRFGCRPEEALSIAEEILRHPSLILEGIMTHFACADNPLQDHFTLQQAEQFKNVIQILSKKGIQIPWHHAANSSGAIRFHFPDFNMVRIGLAVYGLHASEATSQTLELRLAVSLISRIVGINRCKAGETISYGRCYKITQPEQKIAVLPIGYFDGLHQHYSEKGSVIIRGKKAPMVGKICMDFMMVDVTDIPSASVGDSVLVFGEDEYGNYLSPEDFAFRGNSIVHELITCIGPRIQRIFVYEESLMRN